MTTMAVTVAKIRRILADNPVRLHLNGALADTTDETVTLDSTDIAKVQVGQLLEHDDGGATSAEQRQVISVDSTNSQFEAYRGFNGSTAATHADNSFMLINPRFPYDTVAEAVNAVLDTELFENGIYDLIEHQVTSNSDGSADYNAPASTCEEFMAVYQLISGMTAPEWFPSTAFSRYPTNVDTSLYSNGKVFWIKQNLGTPGTDIFYVSCAERLTISTLTSTQERIVQFLACAYLMEWSDARRIQGPTNQGDRTVRPNQAVQTGAYYRNLAGPIMASERSRLRKLNPPAKVWRAR